MQSRKVEIKIKNIERGHGGHEIWNVLNTFVLIYVQINLEIFVWYKTDIK